MTRAVLSIGSNLGDRAGRLRGALDTLRDGAAVLAVSPVYETPPWGDVDQPAYLNVAVLAAAPGDDPRYWLRLAGRAEVAAGRVRDPARRFGPRTLDVDVIAVYAPDGAAVTSADPELTLPHPRAHLRAFVLRPWLDVEPDARLPGHGRVADLVRTGQVASDLAALRPFDGAGLGTMNEVESTHSPGSP